MDHLVFCWCSTRVRSCVRALAEAKVQAGCRRFGFDEEFRIRSECLGLRVSVGVEGLGSVAGSPSLGLSGFRSVSKFPGTESAEGFG